MIYDNERTDARLLRDWIDHQNREALGALVDRYAPLVLGVCLRQCRQRTDAEDAFQVTFMILARSSHSIRDATTLPAWLHATAYRVAARSRQQRDVSDPVALDALPARANDLPDVTQRHELQVLDEELNALPETLRTPLVLHYLEGQRVAEVADQLGSTHGTIRGRLQRGRHALRRRLILRGVSLGSALVAISASKVTAATTATFVAQTHLALSNQPETFAPQPTADSVVPNSATTQSSTLFFSSTVGVVMRSASLAIIGTLMLTLWISYQGPEGEQLASSEPAQQGQAAQQGQPAAKKLLLDQPSLTVPEQPTITQINPSPSVPLDRQSPSPATAVKPSEDNSDATPGAERNSAQTTLFQAGGMGGMGGMGSGSMGPGMQQQQAPQPPRPRVPEPTAFEEQLADFLSQPLETEISAGSVQALAKAIESQLQIPVVVSQQPQMSTLSTDQPLTLQAYKMPLGVSLKNALRPLMLRTIIRDDAIMIVPDTVALAKQGIGTSRYINVDDAYVRKVEEALQIETSLDLAVVPLNQFLSEISASQPDASEVLQFRLDMRALEDLGLTDDLPVEINMSDVSIHDMLQVILRDHDLALRPRNGFVEVTTIDKAQNPENMMLRVYWLDGTGFGSIDSALMMIQTVVTPDVWEMLGGPATCAPVNNSSSGRLGIVVAAPFQEHREIESLLKAIREGIVDPNPNPDPPSTAGPSGGMTGMGGGMGGWGGGGGGMM
ncbi:RNA polymerase sigma factor [Planctomycetaceae bacterium SH139]